MNLRVDLFYEDENHYANTNVQKLHQLVFHRRQVSVI